MIKTSILAVLIFTAGVAFGGQYVSCTFSESDTAYGAVFNDEEATDLYYQIGSLQAQEREMKQERTGSSNLGDEKCREEEVRLIDGSCVHRDTMACGGRYGC